MVQSEQKSETGAKQGVLSLARREKKSETLSPANQNQVFFAFLFFSRNTIEGSDCDTLELIHDP